MPDVELFPIEIKSTATWRPELESPLRKWLALSGRPDATGIVIYDGDSTHGTAAQVRTAPWWKVLQPKAPLRADSG